MQQPRLLPGPAVPGCSLICFHFLWVTLCPQAVYNIKRNGVISSFDIILGTFRVFFYPKLVKFIYYTSLYDHFLRGEIYLPANISEEFLCLHCCNVDRPTKCHSSKWPLSLLQSRRRLLWLFWNGTSLSRSAGNDTQKVGGQSTYISVSDRSLRPIGELLPRLRGTRRFSSAEYIQSFQSHRLWDFVMFGFWSFIALLGQ